MPVTNFYNQKIDEKLGLIADKIREFPIVVGGSLIISVIREEEYLNSDIDIYVGYNLIRREDRSIDHPFNDFIVNEIGGVMTDNVNYQNKSYKYVCKDVIFNIIHTGCSTKEKIIQYINNTADLDICTSTYDGTEVRFTISILTKLARVINQHLLESTFISTEIGKEREKSFEQFKEVFELKRKTRQFKYISRGFKISGSYLDEVDCYNASTFIANQIHKENLVHQNLRFVADEVKRNVDSGGNMCLSDFLKGRKLFHFRNDAPILSIHSPLTYEFFPWVEKWTD